jgi:multiple sugar transport system substrate-binding protein
MQSYIYKALILFILLLNTASCTNTAVEIAPMPTPTLPAPTPTPEPVTITWAFWGDPWEVEINERVVQLFEADHPNIHVETFHRPWNDYFKELRAKFEAGEPVPDILFWAQAPIDIPKGYFTDLAPIMATENYDLEDFFPGLLIHFQVGEAIYGLPRDSDTKVIFYNKRLFNRANLSFPKKGWTWDELRTASLALKEANVTEYSFAYEADHWWMIWMWANGVQVFDDPLFPTKTDLGDPAAAEAVQFFADLTNVDQVTPAYEVLRSSEEIATLFREEKLAMAFGNHALIPAFADIEDFEWDVVELPQRKREANLAAGAGYVISSTTQHPEAAWTFLKFLAGPKGQAIFTESGVVIPARRSVAEADLFMKQSPAHNAQAFLNGVEIGEPNPAFPGANEIITMMNEEVLPPVWRGEQDAASAIQAALPDIEHMLAASQPPER